MTDSQHLAWIVGRLINVHGENPSVDYMIRLQEIVKKLNLPSKAEPKEWPQVGDEVSVNYEGAMVKATVCWQRKNNMGSHVSLVFNSDFKSFWCKTKHLKKPKTEVEILRDELHECITDYSSSESLINDLINKFNITKKV